jgi:hypothetical protein
MAAGNTYTQIASTTLGSSTASVTFSSISSAYTDIKIVISGVASGAGAVLQVQFNGDTTSGLYSMTELWGTGSIAGSNRRSSENKIYTSYQSVNFGNSDQANAIIEVMNYSNSTTNKTVLARTNSPSATYPGTAATAGLWRNTNAINSITLTLSNFLSGTTLSLYGITAA